ncbi:MAG: hypothetical protein AAGJ18_18170, partial [Bacteroidota bacterium]
MTHRYNLEIAKVSKVIIEEMFQVQKGETVAITADTGTDRQIVDSLAAAAYAVGGIPMVIYTPMAREDGQAGMPDWPAKALTAALCEVDVWIELNVPIILYSDIWETAMTKNKKLRYIILAESSIQSMVRMFTGFDITLLGKLLHRVKDLAESAQKIRVTSQNGTDVTYEMDANNMLDLDDGDYSKPKFGTAPGYVNIIPKMGSMTGTIVFDELMNADLDKGKVSFEMEGGKIAQVVGGKEAQKFADYLAAFDDPNMYKISHHMIGLNPNIHHLCGEIVEDERIWGGVDFGFGHTSSIDMPPNGQPAKSHFDGIIAKTTIYFDEHIIVKDGEVCHPNLVDLAAAVLT